MSSVDAITARPAGSAIDRRFDVRSHLEVIYVFTGERRTVYASDTHFEAPNWSRDGSFLVFNEAGRLYTQNVDGSGTPQLLNTGKAVNNNNDHGISPDGTKIAISDETFGASMIYVVPMEGLQDGEMPKQITPASPSYWHGWSPDGQFLVYTAQREKDQFDIYKIPADGGDEIQLTDLPSLDDGPEFAPDGRIYFNSFRTGIMKIWRMDADGQNQTQITFGDKYGDWFAHISPDNKTLVFISYDSSIGSDHPANKDVVLRVMPIDGSAEPRVLAKLFGGQGTFNVPSWSPDSRHVAFVSYEMLEM